MRIAVNTISTKKGAGGAYQIAYNFLMETLKHQDEIEWFYITSADVDELVGKEFRFLRGIRYFVFPTQPDFKGSYRQVKKQLGKWEDEYKPDVIYTISSPCYFTFKHTEVMRFANAWVTNPNKESWRTQKPAKRVYNYFIHIYQRWFLKRCKYFITQSETVGCRLMEISKQPKSHVKVVPNVLPAVFRDATVDKHMSKEWVDIACIGNPFPHKNIGIVVEVLKILKTKDCSNVRFHLTIPHGHELLNKIVSECRENGLEQNVVNHGRCTQEQLIDVYNQCRMCFLPTLLETFSVSSLEAMHFGLDIVATDYDFNREVIADAGLYYSSLDARDAAEKILTIIHSEVLREQLKKAREKRMAIYGDYEDHFYQIFDYLKKVANKEI